MPWQAWAALIYACAAVYSYVHLHHVYGKTHFVLAIFWPLIGFAIFLGRAVKAIVRHFTTDGKQLGR